MKYCGTGMITEVAIGELDKIWTLDFYFPNMV